MTDNLPLNLYSLIVF